MPGGSRSRDEKAPESPQPPSDRTARRAELLRQRAVYSLPAVLLYTHISCELQVPPEPGTPAAIHELNTTGITVEEQQQRYVAHVQKQRQYDDAAKEPERTAEAIARDKMARGVPLSEIGAQVVGGDEDIGNIDVARMRPPPPRFGGQQCQQQQYEGQQYQPQQPGNAYGQSYGQSYGSQVYSGQDYAGAHAGPHYGQQNYPNLDDRNYYDQDYSIPGLTKGGYSDPDDNDDVPGYRKP